MGGVVFGFKAVLFQKVDAKVGFPACGLALQCLTDPFLGVLLDGCGINACGASDLAELRLFLLGESFLGGSDKFGNGFDQRGEGILTGDGGIEVDISTRAGLVGEETVEFLLCLLTEGEDKVCGKLSGI